MNPLEGPDLGHFWLLIKVGKYRRWKKPTGIEPTTSKALASWRALDHCAKTHLKRYFASLGTPSVSPIRKSIKVLKQKCFFDAGIWTWDNWLEGAMWTTEPQCSFTLEIISIQCSLHFLKNRELPSLQNITSRRCCCCWLSSYYTSCLMTQGLDKCKLHLKVSQEASCLILIKELRNSICWLPCRRYFLRNGCSKILKVVD